MGTGSNLTLVSGTGRTLVGMTNLETNSGKGLTLADSENSVMRHIAPLRNLRDVLLILSLGQTWCSSSVFSLKGVLVWMQMSEGEAPAPAELIHHFLSLSAAPPLAWIMQRICCFQRVCAEKLLLCCACVKDKLWVNSGSNYLDFIPRSCLKMAHVTAHWV